MSQLICHNLSVGYEGKKIISDLSFHVDAGDYLCIVGKNGSGKTTLMKTLLGLHKPMKGEVRAGEGLTLNTIGYLPQQTLVQRDFPASVREIVLSGFQGRCGLRPFYTKEEKKTAAQNLQRMGIRHLEKRCYRELSGGQQQRVLLEVTADMYELIERLNREDGITVIMISHDIEAALKYATHILHIGDTLFFGTRRQFLDSKSGRLLVGGKGAAV